MKPNPGHCPDDAAGKRVRGIFANGDRFPADGSSWAADGRGGVRWTLTDRR